MLQHLEDKRILLPDLPHLVKEICRRGPSAVGASPPDTPCHVSGDSISQRELDVLREIPERPQLKYIKRRPVLVVGMSRRIEPRMADLVTERQHQRLAPLLYHPRIKGLG